MKLTGTQRRYIKRNINLKTIPEIAEELHLSESDIHSYLKEKWGIEKYEKKLSSPQVELESTPSEEKSGPAWLQGHLPYLCFLAVAAIGLYIVTLGNAFVSDDISSIRDNKGIGSPSSFLSTPVTFLQPLIYYGIYHIFGLQPAAFRSFNILFHTVNCLLVYGVFYAITKKKNFAFMGATLFAVHPILIETVAWISGFNYGLSALLFLASFLIYITRKGVGSTVISVFLFTLSAMVSAKNVPLAGVFLLYDLCTDNIKKTWPRLIPYFIASALLVAFFIGGVQYRINAFETTFNYQKTATSSPFVQIPIAITSYLQLIFFPDKLTLYHSELVFSPVSYSVRLLLTLIYVVIAVALYFTRQRILAFWMAFFIAGLSITLLPIGLSWVIAERYVYLSTVGVAFIVAYFLSQFESGKYRHSMYFVFAVVVIALSIRTVVRNLEWKNEDTLWVATGKTSPSDPKTHNNLGDVHYRAGNYDKAAEEFKLALQLNPNYADVYHNLGNVYFQQKKYDLAMQNYTKAISINPQIWQSYQNIGIISYFTGNKEAAISYFNEAIKINPASSELYSNLGILYLEMGEKKKAHEAFSKSLEIDPNNEKGKQGYAQTL